MNELRAWLDAERGRVSELASECGVTHSAVSQWRAVPTDHIVKVEKVTGIPRERLRPELYREAAE